MKNSLQCPIDHVTINENKARIIALFVFLIVILYIISGYVFLLILLTIDFLARTLNKPRLSLLGLLSDLIVKNLEIPNIPVDRAPKRFAAGTGLLFTLLIASSLSLNWPIAAVVLSAVLGIFAFLESVFAFCAGCHVYTFLQSVSLFYKKQFDGSYKSIT